MSENSANPVCVTFAQANILELVLCFATPSSTPLAPVATERAGVGSENNAKIREFVAQTRTLLVLRGLNHHWKRTIDHSEPLWLHMIQATLRMDPPERLFVGATSQNLYRASVLYKIRTLRQEEKIVWLDRTPCMPIQPQMRGVHPNPERPAMRLPSDVHLRILNTAEALRSFLRSVYLSGLVSNAMSQDFPVASILRYRMFLYLKQKYPKVWIIPTADIQFCLLSHIFRTEAYWKDMKRLGLDPGHSLIQSRGEAHQAIWIEAAIGTQKLWEAEFGAEYFPRNGGFTIQDYVDGVRGSQRRRLLHTSEPLLKPFLPVIGTYTEVTSPLLSLLLQGKIPSIHLTSEEFEADLEWFPALEAALSEIAQNEYHVLGGVTDRPTLYKKHLIPSYERFLNLCFRSGLDLKRAAPPYVLDFIWHAHQADPVAYKDDCQTLFGGELWHHPWPHGLGVSVPVSPELKCAWKTRYGTSIEDDWQLRLLGHQSRMEIEGDT